MSGDNAKKIIEELSDQLVTLEDVRKKFVEEDKETEAAQAWVPEEVHKETFDLMYKDTSEDFQIALGRRHMMLALMQIQDPKLAAARALALGFWLGRTYGMMMSK